MNSGIGDAAPNNVAAALQICLLRMAETRAKARALRDAINIGVAAFEGLGDEEAHDGAPERGYTTRRQASPSPARAAAPARQPAPAGDRCAECNAPAGMPHGSKCSQRTAAAA